jgi:uncharacterized protein (DUF2062 family)
MARKLFKKWLPEPAEIKNKPALQFLGTLLHDPNLFHLNRHSVSVATSIGVFVAFLPIIGQMPTAAVLALLLRANLPIAIILVWISNPITIPPIFFATYELGRWVLDYPPHQFSIEFSWRWLTGEFLKLWKPLLTGSLICGTFFSISSYFFARAFWRWHVIKNWKKRQSSRLKASQDSNKNNQ